MNTFSKIAKSFAGVAIVLLASFVMMLAPTMKTSALSIPYNGEQTTPAPYPAFNVFTGTPDGDEHDFLRGKVAGDPAPSTNNVSTACEDGTKFTLRVYVHNGASQYQNDDGNGPSVAHGTKVKVGNVVNVTGANFTPNATISSTNPAMSVTDDMTIRCSNGAVVTMNYVAGSAKQFTNANGSQPISDTIVTTGAAIGTKGPNGDVWGCFGQRVWVTLDVVVKKAPTPPPVSLGKCELVKVTPTDKLRTITAKVTGSTTNATIVGYQISWGDGSTSDKQEDTHTYAKDGTYKITTRVQVKLANGNTEWTKDTASCNQEVTFKPGVVPPVVPPTVLVSTPPTTMPSTGPGSVAGIFAAFSAAGAVAYRVFVTRRLSRQ